MDRSALINKLLFEFDILSEKQMRKMALQLPKKIVRWLGIIHPDNRTRKIFYRATGVYVGEGTVLNANLIIEDSYNHVVEIGKRVSIAPGVMLIANAAPNNSNLQNIPYVKNNLIVSKKVSIEDDAWIGAGAIILPGIIVGKSAIVGAGSVVTHNVEQFTVVAGSPARRIRKFN
ncbi:MAG: acyltransferase [Desulfobacterales bacterium]|nr:acyltransferase [Desulfobacterales bacterium]